MLVIEISLFIYYEFSKEPTIMSETDQISAVAEPDVVANEAQGNQENPVLLTEGSFVEEVETAQHNESIDMNDTTQKISERTQEAIDETLSQKLDKISIHGGEDEEKEPAYVSPVPDPYGRAIRYMERHNVMQIFQKLTAEIIYHRPEDPLNHMLEELQKMKKEREVNTPPPS